jgi:tetratricopeptide (TPR) repeat protein
MAAWGVAMTHDHPLWYERDAPKARAALARVTEEGKLAPKERAYLAAARALYAPDDLAAAHAAWLSAAAGMRAQYPDDDEVRLQHALALMAVAKPGDVRSSVAAGATALDVLRRRPDHPGAAHYVIHAFDDPDHAILSLPAARTYARIAPAAGHAQHMPSHTFAHLGMWSEVVPSNERAYAASIAWSKAHGETPGKYDWHSYSWLVAAHLELGHPSRARRLIDDARALMADEKKDAADMRFNYARMVTDYVIQADRWSDVEGLVAPVLAATIDEAASPGAVACASHAPGGGADLRPPFAIYARLSAQHLRAEAALRAGVPTTLTERLDDLQTLVTQASSWGKAISPEVLARWSAARAVLVAAADAAAHRPQDPYLQALDRLVDAEAKGGIYGPAWTLTALERRGDALLASGKPAEALASYERNLELRPNRALALLRVARAAKAAGDAAKARDHYQRLAELWETAEAEVPSLAEVRAGAR